MGTIGHNKYCTYSRYLHCSPTINEIICCTTMTKFKRNQNDKNYPQSNYSLGMSGLGPKEVRLAPNETNPVLFRSDFSMFWLSKLKIHWVMIWESSDFLPFGDNLTYLGPNLTLLLFIDLLFPLESQNVLKLILKSPRFVPFGTDLTEFWWQIWHPFYFV